MPLTLFSGDSYLEEGIFFYHVTQLQHEANFLPRCHLGIPPCSCDQSQHIPAKKERWSEGHKYAKTRHLQGVRSKTVFVAGHQGLAQMWRSDTSI